MFQTFKRFQDASEVIDAGHSASTGIFVTAALLTVLTAIDDEGNAGNYLLRLGDEGGVSEDLGLVQGLRPFFTATERGGSPPSDTLDLFGFGSEPNSIRYARVSLG